MFPVFFHIGPLAIRAYGVMLALSFLIGLAIIRRESRVLGLNADRIVNLGFVLILFGVLGARLGYVVYHWSEFAHQPLAIINPFASGKYFGIAGLNLQGGMVLGFVAGWIYLSHNKMQLSRTLDAVVPAVAFGIFVARIGCFLNGCCFGTPTNSFLGVQFPEGSPAWYVFGAAHIHPAQLYSSAYGLILYLILRVINRRAPRPGFTTGVFFVVEALFRFAIEFVRYYESAMQLDFVGVHATYNQLVAVLLFAAGIIFIVRSRSLPFSRAGAVPGQDNPAVESP